MLLLLDAATQKFRPQLTSQTSATTSHQHRLGPARVVARDFGYRHAGRKRPALSQVSFQIEPGEIVLLAGASGAGKSTLLHAIAGVLPAESGYQTGTLTVDGAAPDPTHGRSGLVLQDPDTQSVLATIGPDVAFGAENIGLAAARIPGRVRWALECVGLELPLTHPTAQLSGGQKQRLALAGVLAMQPGLLLLDEPTANIDPAGVLAVRDSVIHAARTTGATVIVIEHRLDLWSQHADRLMVVGPEGVLADGPPAQVVSCAKQQETLTKAGLWLPGATFPVQEPRTATGDVLLAASDLVVGRRKHIVQSNFSLELSAGEVVALTGPNGVGKSTTALTLGGLIPPLGGWLRVGPGLQTAPHRLKPRELSRQIGTVFQSPEHQFLCSTVRAELELGFGAKNPRVDELLTRLRLEQLAAAHPKTLSGGEKRRLSVACMMAARVLIVDEPTFGQDAHSWTELAGLFNESLDSGTALVAVTHDPAFVHAIGAHTRELETILP